MNISISSGSSLYNLILVFFCILALGAISGMFSEKVGIVNIGINGTMIFGAIGYLMFSQTAINNNWGNSPWLVIPATLVAMLFGFASSLLFGFATIKLKSSQTISGFAFNLLAAGIALFVMRFYGEQGSTNLNNTINHLHFALEPTIDGVKGTFPIIPFNLIITLIIIVGGYIVLYKTKWGLRFRSIGENPQAADVAGVKVNSYKWQGIFISGIIGSIAGAFFAQKTSDGSFTFNGDVLGLGYLALAIMILGQWNILIITGISFIFSILLSLSFNQSMFPAIKDHAGILEILPYLLTLISVMFFAGKKSKAPAAAGIPYDKSQR